MRTMRTQSLSCHVSCPGDALVYRPSVLIYIQTPISSKEECGRRSSVVSNRERENSLTLLLGSSTSDLKKKVFLSHAFVGGRLAGIPRREEGG